MMVATTHGNDTHGYLPVIVFKDRRYVQGNAPYADMASALLRAVAVIEAIRADLRGEAPFPW